MTQCVASGTERAALGSAMQSVLSPPLSLVHGVCQLQIPVDDDESADLLQHFPTAAAFISNALTEGGRVLVHCAAGISRSATVRGPAAHPSLSVCLSVCLSILRAFRSPSVCLSTSLSVFCPSVCPNDSLPCLSLLVYVGPVGPYLRQPPRCASLLD
jgi:Dual specificity phosphatase, catalytic domain